MFTFHLNRLICSSNRHHIFEESISNMVIRKHSCTYTRKQLFIACLWLHTRLIATLTSQPSTARCSSA